MTRKIEDLKFRLWHTDRGHWIAKGMTIVDFQKDAAMSLELPLLTCESGVVVQQFTGLKDCDGVEIYEGDIIEFIPDIRKFMNDNCIYSNLGHIWFYNLEWGVTVSFNHRFSEYSNSWAEILRAFYSSDFRKETKCEFLDFKLVGNIYENPDLFKQKNNR